MTRAMTIAIEQLTEAAKYAPGNPEREYRITAAWKLAQMDAGITPRDWTDTPPPGFVAAYLDTKEAA